jgi:hypothetical protein
MMKAHGNFALLIATLAACSAPRPEPSKPPVKVTTIHPEEPEAAKAPYHATFGRAYELYIPPWFVAKQGGYDLLVHFHGEARFQAANVEHAKLNVVVVSVNRQGFGTGPYSDAFKNPEAWDQLLEGAQAEVVKSHRADGAQLRRIALSAWSAGFSSIAKVMNTDAAARVDAVLLADGFFTNFTDVKKRTVNPHGLEKFVHFAQEARHGEKLFAITHTTIPTGPYPSVRECVDKLLDTLGVRKTPSSATGPRKMKEYYAVDDGSLHIHGFEGTTAGDHVRQLHSMGETVYPYLKARWGE